MGRQAKRKTERQRDTERERNRNCGKSADFVASYAAMPLKVPLKLQPNLEPICWGEGREKGERERAAWLAAKRQPWVPRAYNFQLAIRRLFQSLGAGV